MLGLWEEAPLLMLTPSRPCLAAHLRIGIYNGEMVFNRLLGNGWSDLDDFFGRPPLVFLFLFLFLFSSPLCWNSWAWRGWVFTWLVLTGWGIPGCQPPQTDSTFLPPISSSPSHLSPFSSSSPSWLHQLSLGERLIDPLLACWNMGLRNEKIWQPRRFTVM